MFGSLTNPVIKALGFMSHDVFNSQGCQYVTVGFAAFVLGVSYQRVWFLAGHNKIGVITFRGCKLVAVKSLIKKINERKV